MVPCSWLTAQNVQKRRAEWCDGLPSEINNGLVIANRCRASCGRCNGCKDNDNFTFEVGNGQSAGCEWITASPVNTAKRIANRCDRNIPRTYVGNQCRETCGLCNDGCKDNESFQFSVQNGQKQVGCDWIKESGDPEKTAGRIANRCDASNRFKFVGDQCRKTCGLCDDHWDMSEFFSIFFCLEKMFLLLI